MNIGEATNKSSIPAKAICYNDDTGLVKASGRRVNGYREYDGQDLHLFTFVRWACSLGFTIEECREL